MKIKRLYENNTPKEKVYYEIRQYINDDVEYLIIPAEEGDGYVYNYDAQNLEEVIEFYFDTIKEENGDFKVIKITEEEIDDDRMKMIRDAKKYNL